MIMKRNPFKRVLSLAGIALLALATFSACSDDEDPKPILVEDGAYIVGGSTASTSLELKGMMSSGLVEGEGYAATPRDGMYEKFIYINAGGEGFKFVVKTGLQETSYGIRPQTAGTLTLAGENDQITATVDTAAIAADGENFTVQNSGLYHVVLDITSESVFIIPISNWNLKLAQDVELPVVSLDQNGGSWKKTEVEMRKGNFKFRYNTGWKVITNQFTIFTNYGGSMDELAIGGSDIAFPLSMEGVYTVELKWEPINGFTSTFTKTGDVVAVDPSTFLWSLIGNAFNNDQGVPAEWNYDVDFTFQSKSGDVYTYKIDEVTLLANGEFKVRRDHDWTTNFGFGGTTFAGDSDNFVDAGGNIKVVATKKYSVEFELNWATDARKLTFTPIQ